MHGERLDESILRELVCLNTRGTESLGQLDHHAEFVVKRSGVALKLGLRP